MRAPAGMTRRRFVAGGALAAAAAFGVTRLVDDEGGRPEARDELTRRVSAGFADRDAARAVGDRYLAAHPDEDELSVVRALRASDPAWSRVRTPANVRRLARRLSRRDYAAGRIVAVDGWYLSETEARICALATFA